MIRQQKGRLHDRYEIEPRPEVLGGGWKLHVFGKDPETGESLEIGGGVFPVYPNGDSEDAYTEALRTAQSWIAVDAATETTREPRETAAVCVTCRAPLEDKVLRSAAGFYIGKRCECGPYSRSSGYYRTEAAAGVDLAAGDDAKQEDSP